MGDWKKIEGWNCIRNVDLDDQRAAQHGRGTRCRARIRMRVRSRSANLMGIKRVSGVKPFEARR